MAEHTIEGIFTVREGITLFTGISINGNVYLYPGGGITVTSGNIPAIQTWLSGLGYGAFIVELFSGSGASVLEIWSECTNKISATESTILLYDYAPVSLPFDNFECDYGDCAPLVIKGLLSIDCANLSCIGFKDETGAYDATTNPGGYGGPNTPSFAQITGTVFKLYDSNNVLLGTVSGLYTPNGTNSVCVPVSSLGVAALTPGATYFLNYVVQYNDGHVVDIKDCLKIEFIAPCCGQAISTNLAINFAFQSQTGCGALQFTDTTGVYNAQTNPGGYGGPNPNYSDIGYTILTFELSNGSTVEIGAFIPTQATPSIIIYASDLGYSGLIPDQIMNVNYQVFNKGGCLIGQKDSPVLLTCNTQICLGAARDQVLVPCSDCNGNNVDTVIAMQFEFDNIVNAFGRNADCDNGLIEILFKKCKKFCSGC